MVYNRLLIYVALFNKNKIITPINISAIHNRVSLIYTMELSASSTKQKQNDNNKCVASDPTSTDVSREWKFKVYAPNLGKSEVVCLTGNCMELGNWSNENVTVLEKESETDYWFSNVSLPLRVKVLYRYCICVLSQDPSHTMVRRWETHSTPRIIENNAPTVNTQDDVFGVLNGIQKIDSGWLTTQSVIQIKFSHNPFSFISKDNNENLHIKLTATSFKLLAESELEASTDCITEVAKLENNDCMFKPQGPFGTLYKDFLVINVTSENCADLAFIVDFYKSKSNVSDDPPLYFGYSHILPNDLKESEGRIEKSIINMHNHTPFGIMTIEYLKIHPMNKSECKLDKSYLSHWKQSWTGLDVGHRGLGSSFKADEPPTIRENTLASFNTAAASGADMIEFDVQLSKDYIPVVHHDFNISLAIKRKLQNDVNDFVEMPMKNLTFEEMQMLKVYHVTEGRTRKQRFFDEDLADRQPFSLLSDVLNQIDPFIAFNIEIKWTMKKEDGQYELDNPFDLNTFIDKILYVVLNSSVPRVIVFSCFNPDVCTALRLKQNLYPVMFLTNGVSNRYPNYMDRRCISIPAAIRHALNANLIGIVVHSEDLLRCPSQVKQVLDAKLVIFCWGDDNNNKENIKYLKDLGLHAVIYDKMDQLCSKEIKESIFLKESREKLVPK